MDTHGLARQLLGLNHLIEGDESFMVKIIFRFGVWLRYGDPFCAVARQNAVLDRGVKNLPEPFIDLEDLLIESPAFASLLIGLENESWSEL